MDEKLPHVIEFSADSDASFGDIDAGSVVGVRLDNESIRVMEERFADYRGITVIGVLLERLLVGLAPDIVRGFVVDDSRVFRLLWPVQVREFRERILLFLLDRKSVV